MAIILKDVGIFYLITEDFFILLKCYFTFIFFSIVFTNSFSCFNSSVFLNIFSIKVKFSSSWLSACSTHFLRLFSLDTILLRRVCRRCTSCVGLNLSKASSWEGAAGSNMRLYLLQWSSTVSQASISSNSCHSCCCRARAWLSWSAGRALSCSLSEQACSQWFFLARYTGCRAWGKSAIILTPDPSPKERGSSEVDDVTDFGLSPSLSERGERGVRLFSFAFSFASFSNE